MKYKLINKITGEEHICEKVVVDGWDYYVSDEHPSTFKSIDYIICRGALRRGGSFCDFCNKVIATNNPSIDIPKVVNEVEILAEKCTEETQSSRMKRVWEAGYKKSQKTHPFSEEDMIEFAEWIFDEDPIGSTPEIIQIWKEQRTKILYYL